MASAEKRPVNIASGETVTIQALFETVCKVAGKIHGWRPTEGPVGTRARGSDNTLCRKTLGWEPTTSLEEGLAKTYPWIKEQVEKCLTKTPEAV